MATKKKPVGDAMEERIRDHFERNYELLRMESGQVLTNELKQEALNQVLFYYRKMKHVAENVTRTEVRLALPEQRTPQGRRFTIEGVVDVVQEGDETWLYDIKTHDPEYVRQNPASYEQQLNVYAHIWQNLQRQPLHHTAIIATQYPRAMKDAWRRGDMPAFLFEFERWDPLIVLPFDQGRLEETLDSFGEVVDAIEGKHFAPRSEEELDSGGKRRFATRVCRNCDARFSCSSYRGWARKRTGNDRSAAKYFSDPVPDAEQNDWVDGNLEAPSNEP
jgi:hypothetical protein